MHTKCDTGGAWTDVIIKAIPTDLKKRDKIDFDQNKMQNIDDVHYSVLHYLGPDNPMEDTMQNALCTKECITIRNSPTQQEQMIAAHSRLSNGGGTSVYISFPSFKTRPCLESVIAVDLWYLYDIHAKYINKKMN